MPKLTFDYYSIKKRKPPMNFVFFGWNTIKEQWISCYASRMMEHSRDTPEILAIDGTGNINITYWCILPDVLPENGEQ